METELMKWQVPAPRERIKRSRRRVFWLLIVFSILYILIIIWAFSVRRLGSGLFGGLEIWLPLFVAYLVFRKEEKNELFFEYIITTESVSLKRLVQNSSRFWKKYNRLTELYLGYIKALLLIYPRKLFGANYVCQFYEAVECFKIKDDKTIVFWPKLLGTIMNDFEVIAKDKEHRDQILDILKNYLHECKK